MSWRRASRSSAPRSTSPTRRSPASVATGSSVRRRLRPLFGFLTVLVALLVVWEVVKFIGGDRWEYDSFLGTGIAIHHDPPLRFAFATDVKLPHIWDIAAEFGKPDAEGRT